MSQPRLIIFAGTVGSGKSTQMRLIYQLLQRTEKVHRTYLKGFHGLSYILAYFAVRCIGCRDFSWALTALHQKNPSLEKRLLKLLLLLDFLEVILLNIAKVFVYLKLGYHVLVEEQVVGYAANHLHYRIINPEFYNRYGSKMIRFYVRLLSSQSPLVFFLDARNDELKKRWEQRGSPIELESYLNSLRESMKLIRKMGIKTICINTSSPIPETFKRIMRSIES